MNYTTDQVPDVKKHVKLCNVNLQHALLQCKIYTNLWRNLGFTSTFWRNSIIWKENFHRSLNDGNLRALGITENVSFCVHYRSCSLVDYLSLVSAHNLSAQTNSTKILTSPTTNNRNPIPKHYKQNKPAINFQLISISDMLCHFF